MKKITLFTLLCAAIFTSCTMEKRHYRSGFYVNFNKSAKTVIVTVPGTVSDPNSAFAEDVVTDEAAPSLAVAQPAPETSTVEQQVASTSPENEILPAIVVTQNQSEDIIIQEKTEESKVESKSSSAADPDFPVWAYILIALILPPLAVALKYGVHLAFWLCLIFTLLGFIPGLIYALVYLALQGNNAEK